MWLVADDPHRVAAEPLNPQTMFSAKRACTSKSTVVDDLRTTSFMSYAFVGSSGISVSSSGLAV